MAVAEGAAAAEDEVQAVAAEEVHFVQDHVAAEEDEEEAEGEEAAAEEERIQPEDLSAGAAAGSAERARDVGQAEEPFEDVEEDEKRFTTWLNRSWLWSRTASRKRELERERRAPPLPWTPSDEAATAAGPGPAEQQLLS